MKRPIVGFHRDLESLWVADLSCGHPQHVRHTPPFQLREWTTTAEGRTSRLGALLDCVRCDRREIPEGFATYRRTVTFTEESVPRALLSRHTTKPGVWGRVHVESGELEYVVHGTSPDRQILRIGVPGTVVPEVEHEVHPRGEVTFHVEFLKRRLAKN